MKTATALLALLLVSCSHGNGNTRPMLREGCRGEEAFCADHTTIPPMRDDIITTSQFQANRWADEHGVGGRHAYPTVVFHPCFFSVGRKQICAAGWTQDAGTIHVSTAQPERTAALIAHETLHARYCQFDKDCDAGHKRQYGW